MGQDGKAESVQLISLEEVRWQPVRYGNLTLSGLHGGPNAQSIVRTQQIMCFRENRTVRRSKGSGRFGRISLDGPKSLGS